MRGADNYGEVARMRRIRIEQKAQRHRGDKPPVLPIDPRDPEVLRAKQLERGTKKA